jgi:adenine/guanine/hypoxanthine permease
MQSVPRIGRRDAIEAIPAFLVRIGIPLSFSVADGLALGFIAYPPLKFWAAVGARWDG